MITPVAHQDSAASSKHKPTQHHHHQHQQQQPNAQNPRRRKSRPHCLLAPRPYEAIYHEQAYLSAYLQQKMQRVEGLIWEYSVTQAQLDSGAEGKTRRRLRKLLNLLQCKLEEASQQERAIFSRLGELYMEQNSRVTWERARAVAVVSPTPDDADASVLVQQPEVEEGGEGEECTAAPETPCPSFTLSECSTASSPVPLPPVQVYTAEPRYGAGRAGYQAVPRCMTADYLESVPEEIIEDTAAAKTPTALQHAAKQEEQRDDERRPRTVYSSSEPDLGSLEYYYLQHEAMPQHGDSDDDDGRVCGSDEAGDGASVKLRPNRFSLPAMQFTWPGCERSMNFDGMSRTV